MLQHHMGMIALNCERYYPFEKFSVFADLLYS